MFLKISQTDVPLSFPGFVHMFPPRLPADLKPSDWYVAFHKQGPRDGRPQVSDRCGWHPRSSGWGAAHGWNAPGWRASSPACDPWCGTHGATLRSRPARTGWKRWLQRFEQVFNPARIFADDVVHDDPRLLSFALPLPRRWHGRFR